MSGSKSFDAAHDFPEMSPSSGKEILVFNKENPVRFVDLIDTFNDYVGKGGKFLVVNESETGITVSVVTVESDKHAVHNQVIASADFNINHGLLKFPSFNAFTSLGNPVEVHWSHIDNENIRVQSEIPFNGVIYMN